MGSSPATGSKNLPIGGIPSSISSASSYMIGGMRAFSRLGDSHSPYVSPYSNCFVKAKKGSRYIRCASISALSFPGTRSISPLKHNMSLCFGGSIFAGNLQESFSRFYNNSLLLSDAKYKHIPRASAGASETYTTDSALNPESRKGEKYANLSTIGNEKTYFNRLLSSKLPVNSMLLKGQLENGLRYVILPNKNPPNRLELAMEVHVGSYDEEDDELGIAHLMESFAFVGAQSSGKILEPFITSSSLTDFHHTVFQIHSPVYPLDDDKDLLPYVLDLLNEIVFKPIFVVSHFTDLRNAFLQEFQKMNTIEQIMEGKLLQQLHSENRLSERFPVGLEEKIKSLGVHNAKRFHERWYHPANATLYVVGDIDSIPKTVQMIDKCYGRPGLRNVVTIPKPIAFDDMASFFVPKLPSVVQKSSSSAAASQPTLKKNERDLRLVHHWSTEGNVASPEPQIFEHEMIQEVSLHIRSKTPLNRLRTYRDMRDLAMKNLFLSASHERINGKYQDANRPFSSIELYCKDSGREGCTTMTLKVVSDPKNWFEAVKIALKEVRQLRATGITQSEFARFMSATLRMSEDSASMSYSIDSDETMKYIIDCTELEHTVMDQKQAYECLISISRSITFEEVNSIGTKMLEVFSGIANPPVSVPIAIVAFIPSPFSGENSDHNAFTISSSKIKSAIEAGLREPVETISLVSVLPELISSSQLKELKEQLSPAFVSLASNGSLNNLHDVETAITKRHLSNGLSVNYMTSKNDHGTGVARLILGGGRAAEDTGAVAVGVRALIESGCVGSYTKEQVDLYCLANSLRYSIEAKEEYILMEFKFTTRENGMRAAFELIHMILEHSVWQDDAFEKAVQFYQQYYDYIGETAESDASSSLMKDMLNGYDQLTNPEPSYLSNLTLESVKQAVLKHFVGANIEMNVVGDFSEEQIEAYIIDYLGTINFETFDSQQSLFPFTFCSTPCDLQFRQTYFESETDCGFAYIAGPAPNRWGCFPSNSNIFPADANIAADDEPDMIRNHSFFLSVTMDLLAAIINSRLCSTSEDYVQASFEMTMFDRLKLGWFGVSIKSPPFKIYEAVATALDALRSFEANEITVEELETAKRSLMKRNEAELKSNAYWASLMTQIQVTCVPSKDVSCLRYYTGLYEAATVEDVKHAYNQISFEEEFIFCNITLSGSETIKENLDDLLDFMENEEDETDEEDDEDDIFPAEFVE